MNSKFLIPFLIVTIVIISFTSCNQTEIPANQSSLQTSYEDLYSLFQRALKNTEKIEDLQLKKEALYNEIKSWNWQVNASTKVISDLSFEEQLAYLQKTQSPQMLRWIERLQTSYTMPFSHISVEQITNDNTLSPAEKQVLIALLAGSDYLQTIIQTPQTKSDADCYAKYQKDCERALQIYAISGSAGAIAGGVVGLAGATAVCALQLKWAEDDYKECLEANKQQ